MTIFTDDFNRPDGGLGNNWIGLGNIVGGVAVFTGANVAYNQGFSAAGRQEVIASTVVTVAGNLWATIHLKKNVAGNSYYQVYGSGSLAAPTWTIRLITNGVTTWSLATAGSAPNIGNNTLRFVWDNGVLSLWVNGYFILSRGDNSLAANDRCAIGAGGADSKFDSVNMYGDDVMGLTATPPVIGAYGQCTPVNLTGQNTQWVSGTPGSPIFTVNHGHISTQTVIDETHATVTVCPDNWVGEITITDPSTGQSVTILASSDPGVVQPPTGGAGQLSMTAVDYIERSAVAQPTPTILNVQQKASDPENPQTFPDLWRQIVRLFTGTDYPTDPNVPTTFNLPDLYARLWGGEEWQSVSFVPPGTNSVKADTQANLDSLTTMRGNPPWTLRNVADAVSYGPGATIENLFTVLGITDSSTYGSIRAYLEAYHTEALDAYIDLVTRINAVRGEGMKDLDDILTAIAGISPGGGASVQAVLDLLNAIKGEDSPNLWAMTTQLNGLVDTAQLTWQDLFNLTNGKTQTLNSVISAIRGLDQRTITQVYDIVNGLSGGGNVDLTPVLALLTEIRGDPDVTLKKILDRIGTPPDGSQFNPLLLGLLLLLVLAGDVIGVGNFIAKVKSGTLDTILDIIDTAIDAANLFHNLWDHFNTSSPTYTPTGPLVYPGLSKVNLGAPIAFEGQATIALPMHGALIDVTTPGEHPWAIKLSEPVRYGRLGVFSFRCDDGRYEPIQPVQWLNQIATPRAIALPTGIVVQCKAGTIGTVTPWTLK